ncbi:flagellar biosynthesis repressor FlbT [Pelagibacterium lentulum]|uniref:Flagellum biosynthesis repressor protein FlbT 1 n=1 Tax=Pelagibacterium lentulum TaxID=2029865 RepID=A0A916RAX7_9HYPH|nr:flagellar biosynthesis repressor FlbT [Pelagibacterium lentulum]GGA47598.1 putative flagellum biosynthesis repressor protein FlbT 1 [Pelagibacterium lentulum]
MALKVELKPGEKMIIGNCVITNSDQRTKLFLEGSAPILREKDILTPATADTPAKSVYLAIQIMYVDQSTEKLQRNYFELVNDIIRAAPSTLPLIDQINNEILTGDLYKALKIAKKLIEYERGLLSNAASGSAGLSTDG